MTRPVAVPGITLQPKSLAQQNTDFTSEGAPPPGQAARAIGAVPSAIRNAASRTPANIPGAHRRAPTGKRR